ncbi:MAG TPA: DUF202 domain-containing protein [Burkholderiales bacterium]|nr:DUF202 domain-containing protein [Burkholderiales bacterium]
MSELHDPRVLFAAERTLLAWSRTNAGLMAFGFLIDRAALIVQGSGAQRTVRSPYRRSVAGLRPVEVPQGYSLS